ncbi:hypothetical protein CLAIMM_03015 [Cladophialophora immunda]|nr:hypothetical protein CLAIMM_03015 [Cladophialophora immunda]
MASATAANFKVFGKYYNIIDGKLTVTPNTTHNINPATCETNPPVPLSRPKDVDDAVNAGNRAFKLWAKVPFTQRRKAVLAFADAIESHQDDFAKLLTQEQGKSITFAQGEVLATTGWIRVLADIELKDEIIEETDEKLTITRYTPLGVAVGIVPWNFPIHISCAKIIPAVLTGNPIIIKPSPFTPYCNLKLVELAQQFFPPGVVQALSGDDNLGPWLVAHPGTPKISFTGSTVTGKKVLASASDEIKRVTLEWGGLDPAIICPDVNIQSIIPQVGLAAFINSGQLCMAIKRVYVHEDIYDEFLRALIEHTKQLKVGNGTQADVFFGPVQNKTQYEKVKSFFADFARENTSLAMGGHNQPTKGYFINPTIVDRPSDTSRVANEEVFGPVLPLMTWKTEEEVIARANNTKMGLGASLEAGSVWVNNHFEPNPRAALAAFKHSGLGSGAGVSGMREFCNPQTLYLRKVKQESKL